MEAGEESDDSSSSSSHSVDQLNDFRERWQQEIEHKTANLRKTKVQKPNVTDDIDENEQKARKMFLEATELERVGKVFEAMYLYRNATHIVPDIEFKIYEACKVTSSDNGNDISQPTAELENSNNSDPMEDLTDVDLTARFQSSIINGKGSLFQKATGDRGVISTGLHFSNLPVEIIYYILRWIVSSDLDMRSLEQCAMVSKGFYLCCRDPKIWQLACARVWGAQKTQLSSSAGYSTWRQMFIERPRVCFNGCYISKTTYLRYGERSFQDQFYRPVHLVEYYRYLRFFPDGTVLMMTSADEPGQCVGKLKTKNVFRSDVLKGHYRFKEEVVILLLKKSSEKSSSLAKGYATLDSNTSPRSFCLQFEMAHTKKRNTPQLIWKNYSITQRQRYEDVHTDFDLTPTKYPPLIFSRVKSYESTSENPI